MKKIKKKNTSRYLHNTMSKTFEVEERVQEQKKLMHQMHVMLPTERIETGNTDHR